MKKIYENIGDKICDNAKSVGILGIIEIVLGVLLLVLGLIKHNGFAISVGLSGFGVLIFGIVTILFSFLFYAFGQITNDIHKIKNEYVGEDLQAVVGQSANGNTAPVVTQAAQYRPVNQQTYQAQQPHYVNQQPQYGNQQPQYAGQYFIDEIKKVFE